MVCSEILTGEQPFEGEKRATLCAKIMDENLRPPLPNNCPVLTTYAFASLVVGKHLQKIDQTFLVFVRILCLQKR
jgi:hypothetical protein